MIVLITPAQQDLARLDIELADRLGEPRDPSMDVIASAPVRRELGTPKKFPRRDQVVVSARTLERMRVLVARLRESGWAEHPPPHGSGWATLTSERAERRADEFRKLTEELDRELAILSGR